MLEISPCRFWGEVGARGAGVDVEPVGHFGLVFSSGVLIAEYVGDLAFLRWYGHGMGRGRGCGGPSEMRKEFQKSLCLSEMVLGDRARCTPSNVGVMGDR